MCSWRLPAPLCARTSGLAAASPSRGSPGMARAEAVVCREPAHLQRGRPGPACRAPVGRAPSRTCRHLQPPPPPPVFSSASFLFHRDASSKPRAEGLWTVRTGPVSSASQPGTLSALPGLAPGWPGQTKGWPGRGRASRVAQGPQRWPRLPSLVVTGDRLPAPRPGPVLMGPHSCGAHVPGHQPPDRRAAGGRAPGRSKASGCS